MNMRKRYLHKKLYKKILRVGTVELYIKIIDKKFETYDGMDPVLSTVMST
jgi:hypothetical protein